MILIANDTGSKHLIKYPSLKSIARLGNLPGGDDELGGDIYIPGNGPNGPIGISIEIKKPQDLVTSTCNGRLRSQLMRMQYTYDRNWLLIVGDIPINWGRTFLYVSSKGSVDHAIFGKKRDNNVPYEWLESLKIELTECNISVHQVPDDSAAASWIAHLHKYYSKPWKAHTYLQTVDTSHQSTLMHRQSMSASENKRLIRFMKVWSGLSGLGYSRLQELSKYFSCIREFADASVSDLRDAGLGQATARRTHFELNEKRGSK